tara:strand:- start:13106 stop:14395 length:1290 start_codon:yes stop_codon:yes gene_type:complete
MVATKATFQKYPAYKDSGVEWLSEIPEGWEILPGLSFIIEGKDKNKGMKRNTVLSLSYGNIRVKAPEELTGLVPESFETYQLVNKGDLIFRPTDLQNDKVSLRSSISNYEGIITSAYLNLRFKTKASPKFYHYLFRAIDNNKVIYGLGSGLRQNINYLDFRRFLFPFPKKEEQTAIANFLDDKTAKIDKAIAQKEKLIALLKERKQIIIQNAVTKGLDPNVKMKDSGVEWIGEIPEHWASLSFRRISHLKQGLQISIDKRKEEPEDNALEYITTKSIHNPENPKHYVYNPPKAVICLYDDILLGRTGNTGEVVTNVHGVFHNNFFKIVYNKRLIDKEYLVLYLRTNGIQKHILLAAGVTTIPDLNHGDFLDLPVILPKWNEQLSIVEYIETQSTKIDRAISLQQTQIEKLKEYKATLIDSAVTGKIKVC